MAKDVDAVHSEMPTDRFHVVDVIIDAARQLRAVRQVIGPTAIPRIVEDDGSIACKAREILDPRWTIGHQQHGLPGSYAFIEQANAAVRRDVASVAAHGRWWLRRGARGRNAHGGSVAPLTEPGKPSNN